MNNILKTEISDLINRDKNACRLFYKKYERQFFGICLRYAKNRQDAQDILQEGFIEIFKSLNSYSHQGSFEGWMKRILVRKAISYTKKYYRSNYSEIKETYQITAPMIYQKLDEDSILKIINIIPEKYKLIFNLRAIEEYSSKEVSDMLSINEATVRSQFHRAKKLIQTELNKLNKLDENRINYGL